LSERTTLHKRRERSRSHRTVATAAAHNQSQCQHSDNRRQSQLPWRRTRVRQRSEIARRDWPRAGHHQRKKYDGIWTWQCLGAKRSWGGQGGFAGYPICAHYFRETRWEATLSNWTGRHTGVRQGKSLMRA